MQNPEMSATVISYNPKTGDGTLQTESGTELGIFFPSFFGGEFAPYPKVDDVLRIQLDTIENRVVEAWTAELIAS